VFVLGDLRAGAATPQPLDLGDGLRRHDDAAPATARELEHRPDERQRQGLAGEAPDDLRAPANLDEGALKEIRAPDSLAVLGGPAQVGDEGARSRSITTAAEG